MSWIVGAVGPKASERWGNVWKDGTSAPRRVFATENTYLVTGGLPETTRFAGSGPVEEAAWIVVGTAFRRSGSGHEEVGPSEWTGRLAGRRIDLDDLAGHFAGVRIRRGGSLEAFVDSRGIRSLYYTQEAGCLLISTRLDWLARVVGDAPVDFETFGSHWRLANQLSTDCVLSGIDRLGPGERLAYDRGDPTVTGRRWTPGSDVGSGEPLPALLRAGTRLESTGGRAVSLGLSGGLDSRVLLAAGIDGSHLALHTFGPESTADARIARRVAERVSHPHRLIWDELPDGSACIGTVRRHVGGSAPVSPASAALRLRFYPRLRGSGTTVIDGGFGEIVRRGYYRRLLLRRPGALARNDVPAIVPYLRAARADTFTGEVGRRMEEGIVRDLIVLLEDLSETGVDRPADRADLMAVWTRLPNFFGREQARLDEVVRSHMPFAQPALLAATFRRPPLRRSAARTAGALIRRRAPELRRVPLARGSVTVPYRLPELLAHAWSTVKSRLGWTYSDPVRTNFLEKVEEWALDTVRSRSVREYAPYDYGAVRDLVDGYYRGAHERERALDWWIAFECWRRELNRPPG